MIITLPFPDFSLSPNRKNGKHWTSTKKAKDARYEYAYYATKEAARHDKFITDITTLELYFIEPDKRKRDLDNMLSSCKSDIDGICAALGIDDYVFKRLTLNRGYAKGEGSMLVTIS